MKRFPTTQEAIDAMPPEVYERAKKEAEESIRRLKAQLTLPDGSFNWSVFLNLLQEAHRDLLQTVEPDADDPTISTAIGELRLSDARQRAVNMATAIADKIINRQLVLQVDLDFLGAMVAAVNPYWNHDND